MNLKERILKFTLYKGISIAEFERFSNLSNGYVRKVSDSIGKRGRRDILRAFPELNETWLLTGEGEMLNNHAPITQTVNGDGNTTVGGNYNGKTFEALLVELSEQRKLASKSQEQMDRLLAIIERMQNEREKSC